MVSIRIDKPCQSDAQQIERFFLAAVSKFKETGLERADRLSKDIAFFKSEYQLEPTVQEDGPGKAYSRCTIIPIT